MKRRGLTVTKSGDSEMFSERCELRRGCRPIGTKDAEDEEGVVLFVDGTSEEEEDAGVELPLDDPERRSRTGLRGTGSEALLSLSDGGEESDSSSGCDEVSSSSRPLGYAAQEDCTWYSVMGVRFSRLADRASKQYRQCSTVAMLLIGADW